MNSKAVRYVAMKRLIRTFLSSTVDSSRVILTCTGKVDRGNKFRRDNDPRPPPVSTPTPVPICQWVRRDKTWDGPTIQSVSGEIWSLRCTERKMVTLHWTKNGWNRQIKKFFFVVLGITRPFLFTLQKDNGLNNIINLPTYLPNCGWIFQGLSIPQTSPALASPSPNSTIQMQSTRLMRLNLWPI